MTFIRSTTTTFNNVGSPVTTAATAPGADAEGTIDVRASKGTMIFFKVTASVSTSAQMRLFSDAARTKEIYKAPADATGDQPLSTPFVDKTPAFLIADDGTTLEANSVYYRISNASGGSTSAFDIELIVEANL